MSFMPNMSAKEIADLDRERGKKFYDEEDHNETSDLPVEKKPWLTKTPVNKCGDAEMSGTKILKSFLSKSYDIDPCAEDLMKEDDKMAKKSKEHKEKMTGVADLLSEEYSKDTKESPSHVKRMKDMASKIRGEYSEKCMMDDDKPDLMKDVNKALSTRSFHIPRPREYYDPFEITRSAMTATTRGHSKLRGPEGVAPLVGDTLRTAEDDANVRAKQVTYKSCSHHGLTHREDSGCSMCNHSMSKSLSCKGCGGDMEKVKGGLLSCKACG